MSELASRAAEPRPAASVVLVRAAPPDAPEPIEVYLIRRQKAMRFLGGFYAVMIRLELTTPAGDLVLTGTPDRYEATGG